MTDDLQPALQPSDLAALREYIEAGNGLDNFHARFLLDDRDKWKRKYECVPSVSLPYEQLEAERDEAMAGWERADKLCDSYIGHLHKAEAERDALRADVYRMQAVYHAALELRGHRAALDLAASQGRSHDFMGQLREREGRSGRQLDRAVDTARALEN